MICNAASISRQGYYQGIKREEANKEVEEKVLEYGTKIRCVHPKMSCKKIYHIIKPDLDKENIKFGRDKFINLMVSRGLQVRRKRRYKPTTNSNHHNTIHANLLSDLFIYRPNQVWVSDITYLRTREGFLYLNLITDYYSRRIMGYSIGKDLSTKYSIEAFKMAIRNNPGGCEIHHSDRGIQYTCAEYISMMSKYEIVSSMTRGGSPHENAVAERINGILKEEYSISDIHQSKASCRRLVREAIRLYNEERPHLSLKLETPMSFYKQNLNKENNS